MRIHVGLLLVSVLFVACDDDSPTAPGDGLAFETVAKASYSGFSEPTREVVRTPGEWAEVWQTLHAGQSEVPALPAIDFDREMVVVAAAGARANGCYSIDVTAARRRGNGAVEFELTETVPGPACGCTQAITQPVHAVRVARLPDPESFVARVSQRRC